MECGWAFRVYSAQLTHTPLLTLGAALKTSNQEFYRTLTSKYMQRKRDTLTWQTGVWVGHTGKGTTK